MFDNSYQVEHDPESITRVKVSWSSFLPCGDRIQTSSWQSDVLSISSEARVGSNTWCLVTGGEAHKTYRIYNTIVTVGGLTERQFVDVKVMEKPAKIK